MAKTIIIVTPPYIENSNGIKSLYKIAHTINQVGGDARLVIYNGGFHFDGNEYINKALNTQCLRANDKGMLQTEIVMYPEIIPGNPLCASKIVRYLGSKDGLLTGRKMNAGPRDFLLAHSKVIEPNAHGVLFNAEFNKAFNDTDTSAAQHREFDVTYGGKGYMYGECTIIPDTMAIAREWPRGPEQLAYLLRKVRYFYTWDSWTATNIDAILCGAVPYFLRYEPWTEAELDGSELGEIPRMDASHAEFYPLEFQEKRRKLIGRIAELNNSWDDRVLGFMDCADGHFLTV